MKVGMDIGNTYYKASGYVRGKKPLFVCEAANSGVSYYLHFKILCCYNKDPVLQVQPHCAGSNNKILLNRALLFQILPDT